MPYELAKGSSFPLGATLVAEGVNFAVYSQHATEVFLLLFDRPAGEPTDIIPLRHREKFVWFDWTSLSRHGDLLEFFRKAIAFTRRFPILQRRKFYLGQDLDADGVADLSWFAPDLGHPRWHDAEARTLCCQLDSTEDGAQLDVERLFFILNAHFEPQRVTLPSLGSARAWYRAIDTSLPDGEDFAEPGGEILIDPGDHYMANPRSTVVLLAR